MCVNMLYNYGRDCKRDVFFEVSSGGALFCVFKIKIKIKSKKLKQFKSFFLNLFQIKITDKKL